LSVWELQYETVAGPYNLSNGTLIGIAAAATIAEANGLLALARGSLYVRAHRLRMPPPLLAYHLVIKAFRREQVTAH
jgi:hypothetical protein